MAFGGKCILRFFIQHSQSSFSVFISCLLKKCSESELNKIQIYFYEWQQKIVFFFSSSFADMPVVTLKMGSSLNPDDIKEGADVYFECLIQSNPKPYKMSWYHNVSFSMSHCEDMREGFSPTTNVAYWVISRVFHLFPSAENLISLFVHTRNVPFTTETFETQSENLINYKFNIFKSSLARKWYFVC